MSRDILAENSKDRRYDMILNAPGGPYDSWLDNMASRPGAVMVPMRFDPLEYPEQQFSVSKVEAYDPYRFVPDRLYYWAFRRRWAKSLGGAAVWSALSDQLGRTPASPDDNTPILAKTSELMAEGKNIMAVTSHFTFEELGYLKALRFVLRNDRSRMNQIGTVVNKLMARQSYGDEPIIRQFAQCSNVYFSYPRTASSKKFDVPAEIMTAGNRHMLRTLLTDLKDNPGHEVDVALTGRQVVPIIDEDSGAIDQYEIPEIDASSVGLLKLFDYVYGTTMIKSSETGEWNMEVGSLVDIKESLKSGAVEDIIDEIYSPIAQSVEKFTGVRTVYRKLGEKALGF